MARKSKKQRLEEQRIRQAAGRDEAREVRRPGRDDFGRMLLWLMIREAQDRARQERSRRPLDRLYELLVGNLVKQGFDEAQTQQVYEMLEAKYRTQDLPACPKHHLRPRPEDGADLLH